MTHFEIAERIASEVDKYNAKPFSDEPVGIPLLMKADSAQAVIDVLADDYGFAQVSFLHVRKDRVNVACFLGALQTPMLLRGRAHLMAVWHTGSSKAGIYTETRSTLSNTLSTAVAHDFEGQLLEV